MKNEALYTRTVDILVDAYFKDTLCANSCTACACGNLIMAANDYKEAHFPDKESLWIDKYGNYITPSWSDAVATPDRKIFGIRLGKLKQNVSLENYIQNAKREILSTGYLLHDFALIESSFEKGYKGKDKMFNGLMSVIESLDIIHENTDTEVTKKSKLQFVK